MSDFIKQIDKDNIGIIFTEAHFLSNDYKNYPEQAELQCSDSLSIKELSKSEIILTLQRKIESPNKDFIALSASFDIIFSFLEECADIDIIDSKKLVGELIEKKETVFDNCIAKISLIISQLSAQMANGTPIITPPQIIFDPQNIDE